MPRVGRAVRSVNLFAGGGAGWEYAARALGWDEPQGAELDDDAYDTREANGFQTPFRDVRKMAALPPWVTVMTGSPPCKRFSKAGNSPAHRHLEYLLHAIRAGLPSDKVAAEIGDWEAALVMEPLRLIEASRPPFVVLEQTPTILPVWRECAARMRWWGYSVATGIVQADWYGVPQSRRRAVLLARLDGGPARLPERTHPWPMPMLSVIDRDPLVWWQRSNYSGPAREGTRTARERGRSIRHLWQPSLTITSKVWGWQNGAGEIQPCTLEDSAALQGLPAEHRWPGGVGTSRLQVGNMIPIALAYALLREVTRPLDRFEIRDLSHSTGEDRE